MTNAGTLTLGLTGLSGNADLSLLNATGSLLRSNPKTGTASEGISDIALLAGTYYVKVAAVAGVNSAGYTLIHEEKYFPDDKAGNSFTQAFNVTTSGPVNEWLGFGDRDDYYKFDLKIGTSATLNLEGINSNVDLFLYDSKFRQLEMSRNTGNSAESITKLLAAGTYYVKATLAGKDNTNYTLTFNIDPMTFKSGGLQLFSASSPLTGSSDASPASNDPLKKSPGMLAS
jgi:hypothetical protein